MRIPSLCIENVENGETIYQRCLLIKGRSSTFEAFNEYLSVVVTDSFGVTSSSQTWPMSQGHFKAMVLLSPGGNTFKLERHHNGNLMQSASVDLTYVPLLQTPPLHCAIMIAKDSPLIMDCPQYKAAGISSTHSSLDAAVAKFRITAYMWQALTAEDMRMKGLGRRSFRLDEEYGLDTTSRASSNTAGQQDRSKNMGSVVKIHLIRSKKTTAQLRALNLAQHYNYARRPEDLHTYFEDSLKAHGGVFDSTARPIVAGMILDSHFSVSENLLLGHAGIGRHNRYGVSLGVFGSHLTYSWPRFFEEIAASLTDTTPPGDDLYNEDGKCQTAWEACSMSQGAFLHEVGHAFGAPCTTDIMARGYAQDWPKSFLAQTAYCAATQSDGITVIDGETKNEAKWNLKDALSFRSMPHFRLPGDKSMTEDTRNTLPSIQLLSEKGEPHSFVIECKSGIFSIRFPNNPARNFIPAQSAGLNDTDTQMAFRLELFDRTLPLAIEILGQTGKERKLANAWKSICKLDLIWVPGSDIRLQKRSVRGKEDSEEDDNIVDDEGSLHWAVMLQEKGLNGHISHATQLDLHVGGVMDGAEVHFEDGHKTPCGPRIDKIGRDHHFGGSTTRIHIPPSVGIESIKISKRPGDRTSILSGIRVKLSNGKIAGDLNIYSDDNCDEDDDEATENDDDDDDENTGKVRVLTLKPADGQRIVGLFGQSEKKRGYTTEFGIITAERGVELPPQVYDMVELQNPSGM